MGFATPTKNMVVRAGQYVSGEGRIYHPYLAGWRDDVSIFKKVKFRSMNEYGRSEVELSFDEMIG